MTSLPHFRFCCRPLLNHVGFLVACAGSAAGPIGAQVVRPEVFGPGTLSVGSVYRGAFGSDGTTFYFFRQMVAGREAYRIFTSRLAHAGWTIPEPLILGGDFSDLYPSISSDGRRMVFASYRPIPGDSTPPGSTALWYVNRVGDRWGEPVLMRAASLPGAYNSGPSFGPDDAIYFGSGPLDGSPARDLVTRWDGHAYGPPERVDEISRWAGWRPGLHLWGGKPAPSGDLVVLEISPIDSLTGRNLPADLWVTRRVGRGWSEPRPLGAGINTGANENFPFFSKDGRVLYFVRDFGAFYAVPLAAALSDTVRGSPTEIAAIPFDYEDARVYVPVRVGGLETQWLVLDTGAQPTVLDVGLAERLGLAPADATTIEGAGGGRMRQGHVRNVRLLVDRVPLVVGTAAVASLDSIIAPFTGRAFPGLIGSQFFDEHVVDLDFAWRVVHLYGSGSFRYQGRGIELPIDLSNGVPIVEGSIRVPGRGRVPARFLIDLGAKATLLLSEPFIARQHLADAFGPGVVASLGAGVGGETRYRFVRVPGIEVGPHGDLGTDGIVAGLSVDGTLRSTWYDALLGAEFLHRYRVTFDYSRRRVYLEPRAPAIPAAEFDMSGIFLTSGAAGRREYAVARVVAGSSAAAADIRPGDRVVAVNGRPAASYSLGMIRNLLRAEPGRTVDLDVERDGRRIPKRLVLVRMV